MTDPILRDSRWAACLFAVSVAFLLVAAALGLTDWPAKSLATAASSGSGKEMFLALNGYALIACTLFWGSAPSARQQRLVVLGSLITLPVFWFLLREVLPISWTGGTDFPAPLFVATALALPCALALAWRCIRPGAGRLVVSPNEARLRWLALLSVLFAMVPHSALGLTATLHPYTFDMFALQWDRAAGLNIAPLIVRTVEQVPGLSEILHMAYGLTPLTFLSVSLLQLRGRPAGVASGVLSWVVLTCCALMAYHLFPITGPRYIFGTDNFASELLDSTKQPLDLTRVRPFPRNGMPSMHFGWCLAASILWWRTGTRAWSRAAIIFVTACTAIATLYNGEHYAIDLIVAVPFVLAAIGLSTTDVPWSSVARRNLVLSGFGIWLVWVLSLRHQLVLFLDHPWLCWLLIGATALVVCLQARWMARFTSERTVNVGADTPLLRSTAQLSVRRLQFRFGAMFFVSGMAALVYQVLFAKELALVFGSTATATFTVLATFLGGMAIGSLLGGLLAHRLPRPLQAYAFVEIGITVYCLITPQLFEAIQSGYVAWATGLAPDAPSLMLLRVVLGATVLLVPTVLMGSALPLLAHATGPTTGRIGERVAWLYFANTAGAALGALLTAYFVIPAVGAHSTTLVAAMLNLMVALGAIELAKSGMNTASLAAVPALRSDLVQRPGLTPRLRWAALAALGLGGLLSLGLEVVYVHMLSIVGGNSVYAFGLMVATFLVGLSLGGESARRFLLASRIEPSIPLVMMLLGLCLSVALGGLLWNSIPDYFASFAQYPAARTFGSREVVRGLVCCGVMIPPTLFIGASYVVALDIVTTTAGREDSVALGLGAAINTLGNITGVLLFGFVLLPILGGLDAGRVIAVGAFMLAIGVMLLAGRPHRTTLIGAGLVGVVLMLSSRGSLDYDSLSSGANVYFSPRHWGQIIDHAESIDGGLTTVAQQSAPTGAVLTLLTNGEFQGNDALGGEMQAQVGFALAPLLHQDRRDRALVIGYGTGVTTRVFHEAGFKQVDVAELSRDIVRMANQHFAKVNKLASEGPGVTMRITDGRNLLLLSPDRYDVVSLDITSIWFAGAASLYNQEFYRLARSKMQPDGVLQQWMQMHHLNGTDLLQIMATLRSEFKFVSLYLIGSQGILVATNSAAKASANPVAMQTLRASAPLADALRIVGRSPELLAEDIFLNAPAVDRFLTGFGIDPSVWYSTDDNLRLEYDTPLGNVNDAARSFADNKALLERFK